MTDRNENPKDNQNFKEVDPSPKREHDLGIKMVEGTEAADNALRIAHKYPVNPQFTYDSSKAIDLAQRNAVIEAHFGQMPPPSPEAK